MPTWTEISITTAMQHNTSCLCLCMFICTLKLDLLFDERRARTNILDDQQDVSIPGRGSLPSACMAAQWELQKMSVHGSYSTN